MRRLHLLLLAAVFGLAGCAGLAGAPEAAKDRSPAFDGLAQLLGPDDVDVLLVHGMCTRDMENEPEQRWSHQAFLRLGRALGVPPTGAEQGQQDGIAIHRRTFNLERGTVRASAIVWSPLTQGLKRRLCYDQTHASPLCQPQSEAADHPSEAKGRALVNALLKDRLLDDCLADAMVFSGVAHAEMVARMQGAVLRALDPARLDATPRSRDEAAAAVRELPLQRPLVFVTESLGSTLTFDALADLQQPDAIASAAVDRASARTALVFMFANQLPILHLARQALELSEPGVGAEGGRTGSRPTALQSSLARFLMRSTPEVPARRATHPVRVISFNDRNDLLSYRLLSRGEPIAERLDVIEVPVRNAVSVLGLFAAPTKAHNGHWSNPAVLRLLVCGHDSPTPCGSGPGQP